MVIMNKPFVVAQITDSHLFASDKGFHCGVNVYHNLNKVLKDIYDNTQVDCIVFTGDLTQDHTNSSYQLFVDAVLQNHIKVPIYYLAGNHDNEEILNQYLSNDPFNSNKLISNEHWQIILLNSKSETPSGFITRESFKWLGSIIDPNKQQLLMMHHHPIDVGYFIDKHGLINKDELWSMIAKYPSIKGIACGHVHQGLTLLPEHSLKTVPVYSCPATSIQFDPKCVTASSNGQGAGYRLFSLTQNGTINSQLHFLKDQD